MITVIPSALHSLLYQLFVKEGISATEANEVVSHLVTSNLMGHDSHGVIRAIWYLDKVKKKEIVPGAAIEIENDLPSSAVVNGNWGFGQPIARHAMELAIHKAKQSTIACVTVRNCNHVGRLGAYTALAPDTGMVGIGMANLHGTSHCVAPFGGSEAKLPTNPISVAFPSGRRPHFLLDMTSSIVAEGKLRVKLNRGEPIPEGWALDPQGQPARFPSDFYNEQSRPKGAILPLGGEFGYKGFALSLAIDALSGALSGAHCSNPKATRHGNACVFIALRIDAFTSLDRFQSEVSGLIDHVKSSRLMSGVDAIWMPGEPEDLNMQTRQEEGIELDDTTWKEIADRAFQHGLSLQ